MKKLTFIVLFCGVNIFFVFLQIDKKGKNTALSYEIQRKERELQELVQQKEHLTNTLHAFKNPSAVKEYAAQQLNMKKIKLSQVKLLQEQVDNHNDK